MLKYYWQEEWKLVDACCSNCVSVTYFDVTASVRDADFGGSIGKSATVSHTFRYSYISDTVRVIFAMRSSFSITRLKHKE